MTDNLKNKCKELGETGKSHDRRYKEGWFDKYAPSDKTGLDIGCGEDPLNNTFRKFDQIFGDGDAQLLEGVKDNFYHTVYASHILEHVVDPAESIARWYKAVKPEGHLVICVPHRNLYEQKKELPSRWNEDHKHYFLPEEEDLPCTLSLKNIILHAIPNANLVEFRVLDDEYQNGVECYKINKADKNGIVISSETISIRNHPSGEYSIEAIIRKENT